MRVLIPFAAALLASLAFAVPAGAAPSFSYTQILSDPDVVSTHPSVATDARGDAIAVWTAIGSDTAKVRWAYRPAGGTFGAAHTVFDGLDPHGPLYARYAAVGMDDAGNAVVAWSHGESGVDTGGGTIQAAYRPAGSSTAFGTPVTLSAPGSAMDAQVAVGPHGQAVVSWNGAHHVSVDGGGVVADGEFASYSGGGGLFGPAQQLSDPAAPFSINSSTTPYVGPDGAGYVGWGGPRTTAETRNGLFVAQRPAGAGAFGTATLLEDAAQDLETLPHLAADPAGGLLVTWNRQTASSTNTRLRWSFRPAGGAFGTPADLTPADSFAVGGEIGMDGSGNAVTAVATAGSVTGEDTPFATAASFRPAGGAFGPLDGLAPTARSSVPSAAAGSDSFAVMWSQAERIRFALRPFGGGAFASARDVPGTEPDAYGPQVRLDGSGDGVGVFQVTRGVGQVQAAFDAPLDRFAPRLTVSPAPARLSGSSVPFTAVCDEACRVTVGGTVSLPGGAARVFRLKRAVRSLKPGTKARIRLKLPRGATGPIRRALAHHRRVAARLTVGLRDRKGNHRTRRVVVKLRA